MFDGGWRQFSRSYESMSKGASNVFLAFDFDIVNSTTGGLWPLVSCRIENSTTMLISSVCMFVSLFVCVFVCLSVRTLASTILGIH